MSSIEVSVVICTINRLELLKKGLFTWINQDFDKNYEIIIVDDGSTDGTYEYMQDRVKKYPNIRYIFNDKKEYTSPANARNRGVNHSQGKYIVFTDAENLIPYEYLSYTYEFHNKQKENYITAFRPFMFEEENMNKIENVEWKRDVRLLKQVINMDSENNKGMLTRNTWRDNHFSMFSREMYDKVGGVNENFDTWGFEGIDFVERMIKNGCKLYNFKSENFFVYHQWHEVNRDLKKADEQRKKFGTKGCGERDK